MGKPAHFLYCRQPSWFLYADINLCFYYIWPSNSTCNRWLCHWIKLSWSKTHSCHNFNLLKLAAKFKPFFRTWLGQQRATQRATDKQLCIPGPADGLPSLSSVLRASANDDLWVSYLPQGGLVSALFLCSFFLFCYVFIFRKIMEVLEELKRCAEK